MTSMVFHKNQLQTFSEEGEMGRLVREYDWSSTPLGPLQRWPQSLRTSLSIMLCSQHPMWIGWGPDLIFLYNDAYIPILGIGKHPWALGKPASVVWAEIWDVCGPLAAKVASAESVYCANVRLFMRRIEIHLEECYFCFSYSPIRDESNEVIGLFCPSTSTTDKLLSERRLKTLGDLSTKSLMEKSSCSACKIAVDILSTNSDDIPFTLLYLVDKEKQIAKLQSSYGVGGNYDHINPATISIDSNSSSSQSHWSIAEICSTGKSKVVSVKDIPEIPLGLADQKISLAIVQPLLIPGSELPIGILITGVNPCRILDDDFRTFFELVAGQISTALQNAKSHEEEKKRMEMMAEIDRVKTLFFSNVSHEFRTPLSLILSPLEDALSDTANPLSPSQHACLELVHRNALRLLKLVNSLLDFSRIEAKRMQAIYEPTDLPLFTSDLASVFRSTMEKAKIDYIVDTPPFSDPVFVDREMWEKIIFNLLSNAFKFTLEGSITVSLRQNKSFAELMVKDTGVGIPEKEIPRLFERFRRVEGTQGRSYEGTGIGLALIQELVKLHGGKIKVRSKLGSGSTFIVSIPFGCDHLEPEQIGEKRESYQPGRVGSAYLAEASRWVPLETGPPDNIPLTKSDSAETSFVSVPNSGLVSLHARILLADDNADMRQYVKSLLEKESYCQEVITVEDGEVALQVALHTIPDIIVSDVMMPKLDGFELLKALRDNPKTQSIPIILLSARAGEEAKIQGLQAGADDYLVKPFSAKELVTRVEAHLKITQIRKAAFQREKELLIEAQEAREGLDHVLCNLRDGFIVFNQKWEITYLNPEMCILLRLKREELMGKTYQELFPAIVGTILEKELHTAMKDKIPIVVENFYEPFSRWYENRISPYSEGICVFTSDISIRKQLEIEKQEALELVNQHQQQRIQEAEDYRRKQAEFIDTLCHELRNPLNGIYGGVSLIDSDLKELEKKINNLTTYAKEISPIALYEFRSIFNRLDDTVSAIDQCAKQQKVIVDDVLDLSKLDNKKVELNPIPFQTISIFNAVLQMFHVQFTQKKLKLITNINCEQCGVFIKADPHRITQVLTNLISNAIKFTGEGGTITLNSCLEPISDKELFLRVKVADSGIGMTDEEQKRLFDRFAQANRRTATEFGGSGLGLAISKTLVEAMGGSIIVTSEKGKGSVFDFTIRCSTITQEEKDIYFDGIRDVEKESELKPSSKNPADVHVMIVEDNRLNQKIICRFMDQKGYQYTLANNGQEALDLYYTQAFDLIFMDVEMPVINGIQATEHIRDHEKNMKVKKQVPIIGISGNVSEKQVQRGIDAGMNAYLKKPYEKNQVYLMIERFATN